MKNIEKKSSVKEALISIKGVQDTPDDHDEIELTTVGSFFRSENSYYICYDESEATGFDGCHTTLRYEAPSGRVTLLRTGQLNSQLIIEQGKRHLCSYETYAGPLTIGVSGDRILSTLGERGGKLEFGYSLDINTALASENKIYITVKQQKRTDA